MLYGRGIISWRTKNSRYCAFGHVGIQARWRWISHPKHPLGTLFQKPCNFVPNKDIQCHEQRLWCWLFHPSSTSIYDLTISKRIGYTLLMYWYVSVFPHTHTTIYSNLYYCMLSNGWPNTYVFTKAMREMLLLEVLRKDVSLVILRPTIITSTYKEPFPGCIEGIKTIDGFIASYGKGRASCFFCDPHKVIDLIPGDMVINAMIVAMATYMNKPYSRIIYHVGSSMSNPLSISSFRNCVIDYFIKHPLMSRQGNPIITTRDVKFNDFHK